MKSQAILSCIGIGITCFTVFQLYGCKAENAVADIPANQTAVYQPDELDVWGEVKYREAYQLTIDFPAVVDGIMVKEGDEVKKGDVLAVLDISEFQHTIEKAMAQKAVTEAALKGTVQDTTGLEAQISQQRRDIDMALTDLQHAKSLYDIGSLSKDDYDKAANRCDALHTQLTVLETQLIQLQLNNSSNYDQQKNQIDAIQSEINIYENKLSKDYLDGSRLISNVEQGIVKNISVQPGSILGSQINSNIVMELIDESTTYISAEVEEEFIHEITKDTSVRIVPTTDPTLEFHGTIEQIGAMAIEKDGNRIIRVRVIPDDKDHVLKPGYTVDLYFKRN